MKPAIPIGALARAMLALMLVAAGSAVRADELPLHLLRVPPGFTVELLARVPDARQMALGVQPTTEIDKTRRR